MIDISSPALPHLYQELVSALHAAAALHREIARHPACDMPALHQVAAVRMADTAARYAPHMSTEDPS